MSILVHKSNFQTKIKDNYKKSGDQIQKFYLENYEPLCRELASLDLSTDDKASFEKLAGLVNNYYGKLQQFIDLNRSISSQSKFRSTFLEELSEHIFANLELVKDGQLAFFNKHIYAGMKIGSDLKVSTLNKDVDFCIGKRVQIEIDSDKREIILPIVAVEVKTYLDATMFGEVQFSSRTLKNATPNVKSYVLMETNQVSADKIIAARYDNTLDEMFVLREKEGCPVDAGVLRDYYMQICEDVKNIAIERKVVTPGRLIHVTN